MYFKAHQKNIYGVPEEDTLAKPKKKTKKTKREKSPVNIALEKASLLKEFNINEPIEREFDDDDRIINYMIK